MAFEIEVDTFIEEATDSETFDVLEFVRGSKVPEDDATIYTDADAALKLARIFVAAADRAAAESDDLSIADEYDGPDEEEITALHERLAASALTFHMKGLAPKARDAIEDHFKATIKDEEEFAERFNTELIAKSIVSVKSATGKVNTDKWTAEKVKALNAELYVSESNKLFSTTAELNYVGAIFDRAINADF